MKKVAVCVLLGAVIGGAYANALQGGFVFDDYLIVVANPVLPKVAAQPWLAIFPGVLGYRPFRTLSYVLDYRIGGSTPWIFHFNNLLYHWLTACVVFFVTLRLSRSFYNPVPGEDSKFASSWHWQTALFTALLWALHPIQTDAVAYISGRRDILSALFFLTGFLSFLVVRMESDSISAGRRIFLMALTALAYMLGLASKEMAITLPLVMFCYDYIREVDLQNSQPERRFFKVFSSGVIEVLRKHATLYLPLLGGAAVFAWYVVSVLRPSQGWGWYGGNIINNFLTVARIWIYYLSLLIYPKTLVADYTALFQVSQSFTDWRALASIGVLGGGGILTIAALRRHPLFAFASLWFAITLLPVSHIIPHHEMMAEHYLYLPSLGFCLLLGAGISHLLKWLSRRQWGKVAVLGKAGCYGLLLCLLVLYGMRTVKRNADWKDELTFYSRLVEDNSYSARARLGLGMIYDRSGMPRMAITHYHVGLKLSPSDPRLYTNLGASYQKIGLLNEAERAYTTALQIVPNDMRVYSNLGFLYTELHQYDKARVALGKAEQLSRGKDPVVYANLGVLYEDLGEWQQARQAYQKAVDLSPTNDVFALKLKAVEKKLETNASQENKIAQ